MRDAHVLLRGGHLYLSNEGDIPFGGDTMAGIDDEDDLTEEDLDDLESSPVTLRLGAIGTRAALRTNAATGRRYVDEGQEPASPRPPFGTGHYVPLGSGQPPGIGRVRTSGVGEIRVTSPKRTAREFQQTFGGNAPVEFDAQGFSGWSVELSPDAAYNAAGEPRAAFIAAVNKAAESADVVFMEDGVCFLRLGQGEAAARVWGQHDVAQFYSGSIEPDDAEVGVLPLILAAPMVARAIKKGQDPAKVAARKAKRAERKAARQQTGQKNLLERLRDAIFPPTPQAKAPATAGYTHLGHDELGAILVDTDGVRVDTSR